MQVRGGAKINMATEVKGKYVALNNKAALRKYVHEMAEIEVKRQVVNEVAQKCDLLAKSLRDIAAKEVKEVSAELENVSEQLTSETVQVLIFNPSNSEKNIDINIAKDQIKKQVYGFKNVWEHIVDSFRTNSWKVRIFLFIVSILVVDVLLTLTNKIIAVEQLSEISIVVIGLFIAMILTEAFYLGKILWKLNCEYKDTCNRKLGDLRRRISLVN